MISQRPFLLLLLLTLLAVASVLFSLLSGSVTLSLHDLLNAPFASEESLQLQIVREIRLPRTMAAFLVGGLLSLSGVIMQILLRNALADPFILGVSGGAAVGALTAIFLSSSVFWLYQSAFGGALLSILLVFALANAGKRWSVTRLLLTGVVVSSGWGALINLLLTTSSGNTVQSMLFWLMGDLSHSQASWHSWALLLAGLGGGLALSRALNVLVQGDQNAQTLGVKVEALRITLYLAASILTASAVVIAGSVGFVGLIVPHAIRMLGGRDHRYLIPSAVLLGGSFLVFADSLARTLLAPQQLPVGVVTALIGVPSFILILRNSAAQSS
ncbi:MAG: ABC transporter permease [Gammaproteobacteria bacterium]|nr:ABC transporter permease [Gammaproteobacteria bacterium]